MSAAQTAPPPAPLPVQSSSLASPEPRGGNYRPRPSLEAMPPPEPTMPPAAVSEISKAPPLDVSLSKFPPPTASQLQSPRIHHRITGTSQMTLAISRSDATRMLEASRKFNVEISKMQDEEWSEIDEWEKEEEAAKSEVEAKPDAKEGGKKKGAKKKGGNGAKKKKGKAKGKKGKRKAKNDDDAGMADADDDAKGNTASEEDDAASDEKRSLSPSKDAEAAADGDDDRTQSSPPRSPGGPHPPKRTSTNALRREVAARNREQRAGGGSGPPRRRNNKPTPLHLLLIPAAERCSDDLISSYLRRMRSDGRTEQEIEACLLLFLDMDKSTKLCTSFEIMGGRRKRRRNEILVSGGGSGQQAGGDLDAALRGAPLNFEDDAMDLDDVMGTVGGATPTTKMDAELSGMCLSPKDHSAIDVLPTVSASVDEADDVPIQASKIHLYSDFDEVDEDDEEEATAPPPITHADMRSLFRCFLTSISTCIHHDGPKGESGGGGDDVDPADGSASRKARKTDDSHSPRSVASSRGTQDWVLSNRTKREIEGIATFAAECLVEFAQKKKRESGGDDTTKTTKDAVVAGKKAEGEADAAKGNDTDAAAVSFEAFGDWYNSGGFSLVPWLELLDLAKWDFASRAAAAASAAAASSERFHKRRANSFDSMGMGIPPMGSIDDDGMGDMGDGGLGFPDLPSLPRSLKRLAGDEPDPNFRGAGATARNLFSPSDPNGGAPNPAGAPPAEEPKSRTVVSFDFTGAMPPGSNGAHRPFHICITEENLRMLKGLVNRTGLSTNSPDQVAEVLLRHATSKPSGGGDGKSASSDEEAAAMMLHRDGFGRCVREIVPPEQSQAFDRAELENYSNYLTNFFTCFNCTRCSSTGNDGDNGGAQGSDHADAKELAVGFSFLCAGNKSTKLAAAFELLDDGNSGHLSRRKLAQYLRSYLTMLVGISLLSESTTKTTETRRALLGFCASNSSAAGRRNRDPKTADMFTAVENGARWTQQQFLRTYEAKLKARGGDSGGGDEITFEDFAEWYTEGGYTVAPWLELLDLSKFLSLINDAGGDGGGGAPGNDRPVDDRAYSNTPHGAAASSSSSSSAPYGRNNLSTPRMSTPANGISRNQRPRSASGGTGAPPAEILFTFPLANRQSLVVLKEDATYVRSVVTQLTLLSMAPEGAWDSLFGFVRTRPVPSSAVAPGMRPPRGAGAGKGMDVDQATFVRAMQVLLPNAMKLLPPTPRGEHHGSGEVTSTPTETLQNFFQSFDLDQIGLVAANELMGGLALLCGGKKSAKLAFAFGLFDGREEGKDDDAANSATGTGKTKKGKKKKPKKSKSKKKKDPPALPPFGPHSLDGTELFLFLRSLLIVLFSCCRQSLHLSADAVSRYIYDTAHTVAEDVMQYRRRRQRKGLGSSDAGRVDFDEFGEWYNEGGFETAPWLELLDLNKWVLLDDLEPRHHHGAPGGGAPGAGPQHRHQQASAAAPPGQDKKNNPAALPSPSPRTRGRRGGGGGTGLTPAKVKAGGNGLDDLLCPSPPPDDVLDPNNDPFFGDDMGGMGNIDMGGIGIDDMDFNILGDSNNNNNAAGGHAKDKENEGNLMANQGLLSTPGRMTPGGLGISTPGGMGMGGMGDMELSLTSPSPRRNLGRPPASASLPILSPPASARPTHAEQQLKKALPVPAPPAAPKLAPAPKLAMKPAPKLAPPAPKPASGPLPVPKKHEYNNTKPPPNNGRMAPLPPPPQMQPIPQPVPPPPQQPQQQRPPPSSSSQQQQQQPSTSLKFHLLTSEEHGGYVISISQSRIRHLRRLVIDSGLCKVDVNAACGRILDRAVPSREGSPTSGGTTNNTAAANNGAGSKGPQPPPHSATRPKLVLSKDRFDSAMRRVISLSKSRMTIETQRSLSDLLTSIYRAFEATSSSSLLSSSGGGGGGGEVDALELASGFTILCGGRKSDKLEHAFDLILDAAAAATTPAGGAPNGGGGNTAAPPAPDDGQYTRETMARYLRSFLTILLSVATCKALQSPDDREEAIVTMKGGGRRRDGGGGIGGVGGGVGDVIVLGSEWAAAQVFNALCGTGKDNNNNKKKGAPPPPPKQQLVGFDDFADWYTKGGYTSIPWLELLDLRKWVLTAPPQPPPPQQQQQQQQGMRQPPPQAPR